MSYLTSYLESTDLHESFKDVFVFNNFVNELKTKGFVTRKSSIREVIDSLIRTSVAPMTLKK